MAVLEVDYRTIGLSFREAEEADFDAVMDLATQLANHIEEEAPRLTLSSFAGFYLGPSAPMRLLLVEMEGRVVGLITWLLTFDLSSAERRVYICDLSVDRAARGCGVGKALMTEVTRWARAHGAARMGWDVWYRNSEAKAFYERLGAYVQVEAIPYGMTLGEESPWPRSHLPLPGNFDLLT